MMHIPWWLVLIAIAGFALIRVPGLATSAGALCAFTGAVLLLAASFRTARQRHRWATTSSFYALTPEEFERHVGDTYRFRGYEVEYTKRVGDQGVDVIARRGDLRIAIQCKRYADKAANSAVQAVHAGRRYHGCNAAAVVCLGGFSSSARALATTTEVELIDGAAYADLVHHMSGERDPLLALPQWAQAKMALAILTLGVVAIVLDQIRIFQSHVR